MRRLVTLHDPAEWTSLAVRCLEDEDENVAMYALHGLRDLERAEVASLEFDVSGERSLHLAAYAGRESIFHDAVAGGFASQIAECAPEWLVENADRAELSFMALARAREPELADEFAVSFVEMLESDEDEDDVERVRELILDSVGVVTQVELPDDLDEGLDDAARAGDWPAFVTACLNRIARLETSAGVAHKRVDWAFALARALDAAGLADCGDYDEALVAYTLLVELPRLLELVETVNEARDLEGFLDAFLAAPVMWRFDEIAAQVRERWDSAFRESPEEARAIVVRWLDSEFDDEYDLADALTLAHELEGFDLSEHAALVLRRLLDEEPEAPDWEPYDDVLLAHFQKHPEQLRELLPENLAAVSVHDAPRMFLLSALSETNESWATAALQQFVHAPSPLMGDDDLANAFRRHGDPEAIDHCLALYAERPDSSDLLATLELLAELGDVSLPDEIDRRIEITTESLELWTETLGSDERVAMKFSCTECDIEFADAFDEVYFNVSIYEGDGGGDVLLPPRAVVCPSCGARDSYDKNVLAETVTLMSASPELLVPFQEWVLPSGAPLDRPTPLLESIRARIADDPTDLTVWDDLAGFGHLFDRPELVEEAGAGAHAVDPAHQLPTLVSPEPEIEPMPPDEAARELAKIQRRIPRRRRKEIGKARKAARFPIEEAWVSEWTDPRDLVSVIVVRRLPRRKYTVGLALVDLACLGVKDALLRHSLDRHDVDALIASSREEHCQVDPSLAAKIVDVGVRYALALGLEPCPEYFPFAALLDGGVAPEHSEHVPTGWEGQPLVIPGPDDDVDALFEHLDSTIGEDAYRFIRQLD